MFAKTYAYALAPVLLAAGALLAAFRWYLEPGRRVGALSAALLVVVMAAAFAFATRRARRDERKRSDADAIASAVAFAAATVVLALGSRLAGTLGVIDDPDLGRRATMVVLGLFLAAIGNAMPKQLQPLSALACDPARVQAFQRFSGWTWTLTGLTMAVVWIALPVDAASPLTLLVIVAGMLMIARRLLSLRGAPRPA